MTLPDASAGLGLRRAMLDELRAAPAGAFDFLECAPDNWIGVGGRLGEALDDLSDRHPLTCHGLSLSLGGSEPLDDAPWSFVRRALYADLLVLGQRDPDDPAASELPPDFVPQVLVGSGRLALVVPCAGPFATVGRRVLIAWKETREAARAVTAALPWLVRAASVHAIACGPDADEALRRLRTYLSAQGVALETQRHEPGETDAGEKLLSAAVDMGADLLVMGCYGHSRAREWVLGGATRSVLRSMTLPVLMSH